MSPRAIVAIATPLESALVPVIRSCDADVEVRYHPDLLPQARYPGDHAGAADFRRTDEQERRWRGMLADADVVFGVPGDSPEGLSGLVRAAPALRWVQATSSRADDQVRSADLPAARRRDLKVTSAQGIHVVPLAEFAMFGMLAVARGFTHTWEGDDGSDVVPAVELSGRTLLCVGLGPVGLEVARLGAAFGMEVLAITRTGRAGAANVTMVRPAWFLPDLLPSSHAVVISLPSTAETAGLIGARQIDRMRRDAVVVDLGEAGAVDHSALARGLRSGQPAAAYLGITAANPLGPDDPLRTAPHVVIARAALSARENRRLVSLFAQNLHHYLRGEPLVNQV